MPEDVKRQWPMILLDVMVGILIAMLTVGGGFLAGRIEKFSLQVGQINTQVGTISRELGEVRSTIKALPPDYWREKIHGQATKIGMLKVKFEGHLKQHEKEDAKRNTH